MPSEHKTNENIKYKLAAAMKECMKSAPVEKITVTEIVETCGVTREQLEHVLRAACQIAGDPNVLIIGSQAALGAIPEDRLPREATASMEVDVAFFDDPDNRKSDQVDGAIG